MGYTAASVLVHTRAHPSDAFTVCPPGIPGLSRTDSSFAALLWLLVGSPPWMGGRKDGRVRIAL